MSEITENHTITNVGSGVAKAIMHSNPITGFFKLFMMSMLLANGNSVVINGKEFLKKNYKILKIG